MDTIAVFADTLYELATILCNDESTTTDLIANNRSRTLMKFNKTQQNQSNQTIRFIHMCTVYNYVYVQAAYRTIPCMSIKYE